MDISNIRYRDRLEIKFISIFLSIFLMVSIVILGSIESFLLYRSYEALKEKRNILTQKIADISAPLLWNLDREHLKKSFSLFMEDQTVVGIRIFDENGQIFTETSRLENQDNISLSRENIIFRTDVSSQNIGQIELIVSDEVMRDKSKERLFINGLFILLIGIAASMGAIVANRRAVTSPLYKMILALENSETDAFPKDIEWKVHNEIGIVISAFNNMMARRRKAIEAKEQLFLELQQAQKLEAVGQLAGGIAHEINTPCQYIGDNLRFLQGSENNLIRIVEHALKLKLACQEREDTTALSNEFDQLIEEVDLPFLIEEIPLATEQSLFGIQQISKIVLAIKEFSHPGAKEKSAVDINRALNTTLTVSQNEWKNIATIDKDMDETLDKVNCLPSEMNQVFLNLIVNAAHAIEDANRAAEGLIKISSRTNGKFAEIRIADNGLGIPKNIQDKVFNPFFTTKEVGRGTGQGLSIARSIVVKKHGGSLNFKTEEGQGTTFIIQLPLE